VRILHLNNEAGWRGGERQTLLLAAALQQKGVANAIACRPGNLLEQRARAAQVPALPSAGNTIVAAFDIIKAASSFDLIHSHTGRTHSLAAATAFQHHKPIVVTRRVDFPLKSSRFNRFKYEAASEIVCISKFIAKQLGDWGVPSQKLKVIPSAVSPPSPDQVKPVAELREELGVAADQQVVGNIAALVGHKDQATLLRAAREIVSQRNDVTFVVIGEGELREDLLQLRRKLGLEKRVRFTGYLSQAEKFLPAFDVFAMSSCMEGLGSIIQDAFAAGVPVAATAAGGIPELVRNGETGLVTPVGNASALAGSIMRLLDNRAEANQLAQRAKKFVADEFSVDRMADQYIQVYDEVLRQR
jgi:glycosyltransferase involved in cell wall biosynthesis